LLAVLAVVGFFVELARAMVHSSLVVERETQVGL
jgi:hypothetical protein